MKSKSKVLIIEDDKFISKAMVYKFEEAKFITKSVRTAENGLEILEKWVPDVIILDILLPGIDGFEVLSRMKKDPGLASIPVIILSNLGQRDDVQKGIDLGAEDYLIKAHFTPGEIVEKIKESASHGIMKD